MKAAFVVALTCFLSANAMAATPATLPSSLRGILVVSTRFAIRNGDFAKSLAVPGVDGALIELDWSQLEPQRGVYDWTPLDSLLVLVGQQGQRAQVSIKAGAGTPDWLFQPAPGVAAAQQLAFRYSSHNGAGGTSRDVVISPPWDPVFLAAFDEFLSHLAAHFKLADDDRIVPVIRLTGINTNSDELRLPAETPETAQVEGMTDDIKIWTDAGYRPALIRSAWQSLVNSFARSFPQKSFGLALITSGAFPGIDDQGRPPTRPLVARNRSAALNADLVRIAAERFKSRLIVQHLFLIAEQPADPLTIAFATQTNSPLAWQTNLYFGRLQRGAAGGGTFAAPVELTEQSFAKLLDRGIRPEGFQGDVRFIEVFPSDAIAYPAVIQQAHDKLQKPP